MGDLEKGVWNVSAAGRDKYVNDNNTLARRNPLSIDMSKLNKCLGETKCRQSAKGSRGEGEEEKGEEDEEEPEKEENKAK